ncbi:MAG: VWA domain-containing protein [Acidobacteria bacterium]|nr:VWA domain-containing protein [Acidobacteriota bacterium]
MRTFLLCVTAAVCAQETTFRATVPVVLVPVTVTDSKGKLVDGLSDGDFVVTDNGRPVKFQFDSAEFTAVPISLIVAVQTNDLSAAALLKIQKIGTMIQALITGERGSAAVLCVDDRLTVTQEFTRNPDEISRAFQRLKPRRTRRTITLDAAERAVEMFRDRPQGERRALLLIGEAKDRGSEAKLETVLEHLQRENIQVYAATYSAMRTQFTTKALDRPKPTGAESDILAGLSELVRLGKTNTAEALSVHTGGRKLGFATLHSLEEIVTRVGEELHAQYLLSFPATAPEGFHSITVILPAQAKRNVAARQGYWAVSRH